MKRSIAFILSALLLLPMLVSCRETQVIVHSNDDPTGQSQSEKSQTDPAQTQISDPLTETSASAGDSGSDVPSPSETSDVTHDSGTETPEPSTETPEPTADVSEPTVTPDPPGAEPWILHETADAGMAYQDELILVGDSTTYGMIPYEVLPGGKDTKQVWKGPSGTITFYDANTTKILYPETGENLLIKDAVAKKKPKYLVVTLGVTGGVSSNLDEESFKEVYRTLLNDMIKASPSTKFIVQSIYPVNKENNRYEKSITIAKIVVYNRYVRQIVEEFYKAGKPVYFSDAYAALADSEGYLPQDLGNGDGLHLSAKGYLAVLKHLRTHALPLQ